MGSEPTLEQAETGAPQADAAATFWARVQSHKIIQWGIGYLGAALALAQGLELLGDAFLWPAVIGRVFMIIMIVGFPVALTLAWYHGHRGLQQVSAGELMIVSVLLLIGAVFFTAAIRPADERAATASVAANLTAASTGAGQPPVVAAAPAPRLPNSIAVLPFDNLSPDPNNAFFAAGIHDEVLNQLGKLSKLNVIARTSVMQYASAARPITEIARELNVETVMEGSVSYAEGRVAVRAQLIDAATGVHLWSDSYNREFADVFAIQADIAMNIANALEAEFSGEEQARIERVPTTSPEAYSLYLQALALGPSGVTGAAALLERAIQIDPTFAAPYADLARIVSLTLVNSSGSGSAVDAARRAELEATVRSYAATALALDEAQGGAHVALANLALFTWRWTEAEAAFTRAVALSPPDELTGSFFGFLLSLQGRHEEAIALGERVSALNPDSVNGGGGFALGMAGRYDAAVAHFRRAVQARPGTPLMRHWLGLMQIARGDTERALLELETVDRMLARNRNTAFLPELAYGFARAGRQADAQRLFDEIRALDASGEPIGAGTWAMAYLAINDHAQSLRWLDVAGDRATSHEPDPGFVSLLNLKMNVTNDPVLRQPEFVVALARVRGD